MTYREPPRPCLARPQRAILGGPLRSPRRVRRADSVQLAQGDDSPRGSMGIKELEPALARLMRIQITIHRLVFLSGKDSGTEGLGQYLQLEPKCWQFPQIIRGIL